MKKVAENFSLHDGNVDLVNLKKDELIISFELLNLESLEQEKLDFKFTGCTDLQLNGVDLVDWKNSSATILKYEIFDEKLMLFLELTDYEHLDEELSYYEISFNFKEVKNV